GRAPRARRSGRPVLVRAYVRLGGSVARLASDAELGDGGGGRLYARRDGAERRRQRRLSVGCVTVDTHRVPTPGFRQNGIGGWTEKGRLPRNPFAFCQEIRSGELTDQAAATGCIPVHLLVVRSGRQHDLPLDACRYAVGSG